MPAREQSASTWPNREEAERWAQALAVVANRERTDRGVVEEYSLSVTGGGLWATYGPRRIRVAGPHAEVGDADALFTLIDRWVAFERSPDQDPDQLLDRDRAYIDRRRAGLAVEQPVWEAAAKVVFRDVEATTGLPWRATVTVHTDEVAWPGPPPTEVPGPGVFVVSVRPPGWWPPRRRLLLPQLWLDFDGHAIFLPPGVTGVAAAVTYLADKVQEQVIEEIRTGWPVCPGHAHPMDPAGPAGASWVCPETGVVIAEIGTLSDANDQ
jgi:hypothetical protein